MRPETARYGGRAGVVIGALLLLATAPALAHSTAQPPARQTQADDYTRD